MDKKKAIICTILFAVVLISALTGTYFIKGFDGNINMLYLIAGMALGGWVGRLIRGFYKWISD